MEQQMISGKKKQAIAVPNELFEFFKKRGAGQNGDVLHLMKNYQNSHGYEFEWGHILEEEHDVGPYRSVAWSIYIKEVADFALQQADGNFEGVCEGAHIASNNLLRHAPGCMDITGDPSPAFGMFSFWAWESKRAEVASVLESYILLNIPAISASAIAYAKEQRLAKLSMAA